MVLSNRRSIRLPEYDYSQDGAYFVTICVDGKLCRLGKVVNGEMKTNRLGEIANECWSWLENMFPAVSVPVFCVMPNHAHAVIYIESFGRGGLQAAHMPIWKKPLGRIIGAYKTHSTILINDALQNPGVRFWQRNYYERVIRNEREYEATYDYIVANPMNWEKDEYRNL